MLFFFAAQTGPKRWIFLHFLLADEKVVFFGLFLKLYKANGYI